MVICAGFEHHDSFLKLYDFQKRDTKIINVEKIDPKNVEAAKNLFQNIKKSFNERIDCFCICLDNSYNNEFRKNFIEIAKHQNGIETVRIISLAQAKLYFAIKYFSITPVRGENIWVLSVLKKFLRAFIWKYDCKWKFQEFYSIKRFEESSNRPPKIEELQHLKQKIENEMKTEKVVPHILITYGNNVVNRNEFESIFSTAKKIYFKDYAFSGGIHAYAQNYFDQNISMVYQCHHIAENVFGVEYGKETLCITNWHEILPLSVEVDFQAKSGDTLYISDYFNPHENEPIPDSKVPIQKDGNFKIILRIDINGIYTLDLQPNNENKKIFYIPKKLTSYDPTHNAIGIDFGTTECCAAVIRKNGPDFVQLDPVTSNRTMPSYVAFDEKEPKCGQIVVDRMRYKAEYSVYDIKRIIGKSFDEIIVDKLWPFKIVADEKNIFILTKTFDGQNVLSPQTITSTLLEHIKSVIETYQSNSLKEAVITIPCAFTEKQKNTLKLSATLYTGWKTIHFIPEPIAAAFAYFTETSISNKSIILICDCGGGTVDICIAKANNEKLEIISFDGDPYLGGRDFDRLLFNHFQPILKHKYSIDVMKNSKKFILKQKCQDIKHNLSVAMDHWLDVSDFDYDNDDIIKITRDEFETMATDLLLRIKNIICQAYTKSNLQKNQIDFVFQVGGGCRMPMIKDLLKEIFPNAKHQCTLYPDWVVAHGAALYAYSLKSDKNDESEDKKQPQQVEKKRSLFDKIFKK